MPMDCSFLQYKIYTDIRAGSLERGQTTVGCYNPTTRFGFAMCVISLPV